MDFSERLSLYREGGMLTDEDIKDIEAILALFKDKYEMVLEEENADFFIAHISAAYNRNKTAEPVEELPEEVLFCKLFSMVLRSKTVIIFCKLSLGVAVPTTPTSPVFRFFIVGAESVGKAPCFCSRRKVPVIAF